MMRSGRDERGHWIHIVNRVSLPGLSLSAAVVLAALIALFVLESGDSSPGAYQAPPEGSAIVRLQPTGRNAVAGRHASSPGPKALRRAAALSSARARQAVATARVAARHGGRAPRGGSRRDKRLRTHGASRLSSSRRGSSGLGPGNRGQSLPTSS